MQLSEKDFETFQRLRAAGVLQSVVPNELIAVTGIGSIGCGDADQSADFTRHLMGLFSRADKARIHLMKTNGGALSLSPSWPRREDWPLDAKRAVLLQDLDEAKLFKGIGHILLGAHAPCGVAAFHGVDLEGVIRHLVGAKRYVQAIREHFVVRCILHVQLPCGARRTFFVSCAAWEALSP